MLRKTFAAWTAVLVLILTGCTGPAWLRPEGHPADAAAPAGSTTSITALERYRQAVETSAESTPDANEKPSPPAMDHRGHHGRHEEMKP